MLKKWALLPAFALLAFVLVGGATATGSGSSGGSRTWVQDFEKSTAGWYDLPPGTIHRVPSGYVSPSGYASGIASAHGKWHARLRNAGCGATRLATTCFGPFTRWGKPTSANPVFPKGGYMTEVDVYLDTQWAAGRPDYRFDWSSAINDNNGMHQRDFVFNVGTDPAGLPKFWVNASTNATRSGAFPQNPCPSPSTPPNYCRLPVEITQTGWYTFRHEFYPRHHMGTDYLAVDFTVLRHDGVVMANWFLTVTDFQDPVDSDRMSRIGGDRYGWFVINEIDDLAIDCSNLRPRAIGHPPLRDQCLDLGDHDDRDNGDDADDDERREKYDRRWDDDD